MPAGGARFVDVYSYNFAIIDFFDLSLEEKT